MIILSICLQLDQVGPFDVILELLSVHSCWCNFYSFHVRNIIRFNGFCFNFVYKSITLDHSLGFYIVWLLLGWAYWACLGPALPTSKSWDPVALGLLGLSWAYLDNEQILGSNCSGPIRPTFGLPCQRANPWIPLL